ncbi:hypothetical protein FKM82_015756 [Ascaphus truei]
MKTTINSSIPAECSTLSIVRTNSPSQRQLPLCGRDSWCGSGISPFVNIGDANVCVSIEDALGRVVINTGQFICNPFIAISTALDAACT